MCTAVDEKTSAGPDLLWRSRGPSAGLSRSPGSAQAPYRRVRENLLMATIAFDLPPVLSGRQSQRRAVSIPAPAIAGPPSAIEHVLPLSGCRLTVLDLPDGSRVGRLTTAEGRWLDETRCELEPAVSGWFGRSGPCGTSW